MFSFLKLRIPISILLISLVLCSLGCRKKLSTPVNLYGLWVSLDGNCSYMYLDIKKEGDSSYGTNNDVHGCALMSWKGKSRRTESHLYIGITKLKFIEQPKNVDGHDTIGWPGKRGEITAKMTLKTSAFHSKQTYTFYKIKSY